MQLRHVKSLSAQDGQGNKVSCMAWSPNNQRLAVATSDRVISLYDEAGERRDKFATKPSDKASRGYIISGLAWSPDSTRLAVAQTDNILFVYRLGIDWADKKSICNKFPSASAVTCVSWPNGLANEVVYGTSEGKVRQGSCRSNKAATLYAGDGGSYVTAITHGPDGRSIAAAHADGSIYRVVWDESGSNPGHARVAVHSCPPFALAWGAAIVAAGSDGRVCFYDSGDGSLVRTFDKAREGGGPCDWSCASMSPSGEAVTLGTYGGPALFALGAAESSPRGRQQAAAYREWSEIPVPSVPVPGLHNVTCVSWKPDGSKVALGSAGGAADLWDACLRRTRWKDRFEFTYVSLSSVIVKRLVSGVRIVLRSSFGHEIVRVQVVPGGGERYIAAYTPATLLVGDLESCKLSEVPWSGPPPSDPRAKSSSNDTFLFGLHPSVALVSRAGELAVVEYGRTEALATVRTEHVSRSTLSVRVIPGPDESQPGLKRLAYLVDGESLRVMDLVTGAQVAGMQHDCRITWLDMSGSGQMLLFRDKRKRLHLLDMQAASSHDSHDSAGLTPVGGATAGPAGRTTLLPFASYACWVPGSDVIVAQRRGQLCCWYNPRRPDAVATWNIRGDVTEVARDGARVEVLVDEGLMQASYALDGALIAFAASLESGDLAGAALMLESLPQPSGASRATEHSALWSQLGREALARGDLAVAQRAATATGDIARSRFLAKTLKIANLAAERMGGDGRDHPMVRARLAQLRGDIAGAEAIFLQAGRMDSAIEMHQSLQRYEDAISLAESRGQANAADMRAQVLAYLQASGQEERAGAMREAERDKIGAIELYLKGGSPARALSVVLSSPSAHVPRETMDRIVAGLAAGGLYEKAGQLLERLGDAARALEAYIRGRAFRQAVDLARRSFPARLVELERAWGDHLVSCGNPDAAINHFMEAGAQEQAVKAALDARQWIKASQLLQDSASSLPPEVVRPAWMRLARYHSDRGALEEAEKAYLRAGEGRQAVDMYIQASKHDAAYRVARTVMPDGEVVQLFVTTAQRMEAAGNLRAAEKLFVTVRAFDAAITMYKRARAWEPMLRLVSSHRPEGLREARLAVAEDVAAEGSLRAAEKYWVEAGDWEAAANAYRGAGQWEDALRVARAHGPPGTASKLAYAQATALGPDAGMALLARLGMVDVALEYACQQGAWDHALALAARAGGDKKLTVHLKRGMALEDQGDFGAAEAQFVAAEKPREAIEMHLHNRDWAAALRVAENYDPGSIPDILVAQGTEAAQAGDLASAEALYVDGRRPEMAVDMYLQAKAWAEALRVAKRHLPGKVAEVQVEVKRGMEGQGLVGAMGGGAGPARMEIPAAAVGPPSPERRGRHQAAAPSSSVNPGPLARAPAPAAANNDPLSVARSMEAAGEAALAVDAYLAVVPGQYDQGTCQQAWASAIRICASALRNRHASACDEVGSRLYELGRLEAAGDTWRDGGSMDKAARAYGQAGNWAKARSAASSASPAVRDEVEAAYRASLLASGDPDKLAAAGQLDAAIRIYEQQGQQDKVLELAARGGSAVLAKHLYPLVEACLDDSAPGSPQEAWARAAKGVGLMGRYGAPAMVSQLALVRSIVAALWAGDVSSNCPASSWVEARDVVYKYAAGVRKAGAEAPVLAELDKLVLGVHYAAMRTRAVELGNPELVARLSMSLLRLVGPVFPAERLFYEAGCAARDAGWKSAAVVLYNRFIDLSEAIEDGAKSGKGLDNGDFAGAGIPSPAEMPLPSQAGAFVPPKAREAVKDWVLAVTMDTRMEHSLPKRPCLACSEPVFEAGLGCQGCKATFPACVVSGYPIPASQMVSCGACGSKASKAAWNVIVAKTKACPWCSAAATAAM